MTSRSKSASSALGWTFRLACVWSAFVYSGTVFGQQPETVQFTTAGFSGAENNNSVQISVRRSTPWGPPFTFQLFTFDGSAVAGVDYVGTNMAVNFPSGITNRIVLIKLLDDAVFEGIESFHVVLTNASNGVTIGSPSTADVSIVDNESNVPGSVDASFNDGTGLDGPVLCLAERGSGKILVGGSFNQAEGEPRHGLAQFTREGALDLFSSPAMEAGDVVLAMAERADRRLWVARTRLINGLPRGQLLLLNASGMLDAGFGGGSMQADAPIRALLLEPDGSVLVGGAFTTLAEQPRAYVARVLAEGILDPDYQPVPNQPVNCLARAPDNQTYLGGEFSTINGQTRVYVALLHSNGALDNAFVPGDGNTVFNGTGVKSLAVHTDGKPVLGGDFSVLYGRGQSGLMRLLTSGLIDDTYRPNLPTGDKVSAVVLQADGKVIAGGNFVRLADPTCCVLHDRKGLARFNLDGSVDTSFRPGSGIQPADVQSLLLQSDLKIVAGGSFTNVNGLRRVNLARFFGDIRTRIMNWAYDPQTGMELAVTNEPGRTYIIEGSTNLTTWTPVYTNSPGTNSFQFVDPVSLTTPRRVYRVREVVP